CPGGLVDAGQRNSVTPAQALSFTPQVKAVAESHVDLGFDGHFLADRAAVAGSLRLLDSVRGRNSLRVCVLHSFREFHKYVFECLFYSHCSVSDKGSGLAALERRPFGNKAKHIPTG